MIVAIMIRVCLLFVFIIFFSRLIFENIPGLAVQGLAESGQGREAYGLGLACLEDGQVGGRDPDLLRQLSGRHLPLCQHYVYVYYDRHFFSSLDCHCFFLVQMQGYVYDFCEQQEEERNEDFLYFQFKSCRQLYVG